MKSDEKVYLNVGWESLEKIFNGKTLDEIKTGMQNTSSDIKDSLITDLVELVVNMQENADRNERIFGPILTGEASWRR